MALVTQHATAIQIIDDVPDTFAEYWRVAK